MQCISFMQTILSLGTCETPTFSTSRPRLVQCSLTLMGAGRMEKTDTRRHSTLAMHGDVSPYSIMRKAHDTWQLDRLAALCEPAPQLAVPLSFLALMDCHRLVPQYVLDPFLNYICPQNASDHMNPILQNFHLNQRPFHSQHPETCNVSIRGLYSYCITAVRVPLCLGIKSIIFPFQYAFPMCHTAPWSPLRMRIASVLYFPFLQLPQTSSEFRGSAPLDSCSHSWYFVVFPPCHSIYFHVISTFRAQLYL